MDHFLHNDNIIRKEIEILNIEQEISSKVKTQINKNQKEYYLREQMRVIREELGEGDDFVEFDEYRKKIRELHLQEDVEKKLLKDVDRLKKQPFGSAEASVLRNYLDAIVEGLPGRFR